MKLGKGLWSFFSGPVEGGVAKQMSCVSFLFNFTVQQAGKTN